MSRTQIAAPEYTVAMAREDMRFWMSQEGLSKKQAQTRVVECAIEFGPKLLNRIWKAIA